MATFNDLISLVDQKIPDVGAEEIDPIDVRGCFYALIASFFGQGNIATTPAAGDISVTVPALIGKTVSIMVGEAFSKSSGFNQPTSNGTVTLTDGSTFPGGNVVFFYS